MAINLLPDFQKKELATEYLQKRIFLVFVFATFSLVIFVFIMFGLRHYVSERVIDFAGVVLSRNDDLEKASVQETKKIIANVNQDLTKIVSVQSQTVFTASFLEKIASLTSANIYFTNISLEKNFRKIEQRTQFFADVDLKGIAKTREDLYEFRKILAQESSFENAYFAPYSWIDPVDAEFSLSLIFIP